MEPVPSRAKTCSSTTKIACNMGLGNQDSRTLFISIFLYSIVHFSQYSRHIRQRFVEDVSEVYHKTFFQISLLCWRILLKVGYNVNSVPFALHFSSTGVFEQSV